VVSEHHGLDYVRSSETGTIEFLHGIGVHSLTSVILYNSHSNRSQLERKE
jgi:hypothetical protein